ncbi:MAG: NnrU family protein [Woeseiaceae bacterium]
MDRFILGLVIFFGVHSISLLALGWRNRVAERLGRRAWQGVYSVAALIGLYLLVSGYGAARVSSGVLYVSPHWLRYVAALLMLPVFTLALASVLPGRIRARAGHPLLLATMLWAVAHLLTNGSVADLLLFGAFLVWAVSVRISLERRPARSMHTLPASSANDAIVVVGGLALYAIFMLWLHARWFGVAPLA